MRMRHSTTRWAGLAILLAGSATADDLTIPNTFQANTPARAADVNANFTAVEASVDDNAADIAANLASIESNTQDIAALSQSVSEIAVPVPYVFVGFSTATVTGDVGFFGMNETCQADYGPDARMTTSQAIIESTIQPTLSTSGAWARPVFVSGLTDISGFTIGASSWNCVSWSSTNSWGFGVKPMGIMDQLLCSESLQVACEIPQ